MTYPNQLKIKIHKPTYDDKYVDANGPFLQIGIEEWQEAFRNIKGNPSAMGMYLYLASNINGYTKHLSKADFEKVCAKGKSSYHRAIDLLKEKGYIYKGQDGSLNFATTPHESCEIEIHKWDEGDTKKEQSSSNSDNEQFQNCNATNSDLDTEIYKTNSNTEDKYNKELKKASPSSPSSSLDYLKDKIRPNGNYKENTDKWLEDEVIGLWTFVKAKDNRLAREIYLNTDFSLEESRYIANNILNWNSRVMSIREGDF